MIRIYTHAGHVFEPIYGTRDLHSSKEGFIFHSPMRGIIEFIDDDNDDYDDGENISGSSTRRWRLLILTHPRVKMDPPYVCNQPSYTNGEHFDQQYKNTGVV